jgi:hypothetical protein
MDKLQYLKRELTTAEARHARLNETYEKEHKELPMASSKAAVALARKVSAMQMIDKCKEAIRNRPAEPGWAELLGEMEVEQSKAQEVLDQHRLYLTKINDSPTRWEIYRNSQKIKELKEEIEKLNCKLV